MAKDVLAVTGSIVQCTYFGNDFIVEPGADIKQIQLSFKGQSNIEIKEGKLFITTTINTVIENAPYVYQSINGKRVEIACHYKLENGIVSFEFPESYNSDYELIIDPVLVFSTYSGSTASNWGFTATYDNLGYYYGGGIAGGPGYPVTPGAFQTNYGGGTWDAAITKYNPDGTAQIYATYIGGSGTDRPHSMIVDGQNNLIVYGSTNSTDFPTTTQAYDDSHNGGFDIFITKLTLNGDDIIGSTYVGGSSDDGRNNSGSLFFNYGDASRGEVMVNALNQVFVASSTESSNFPTTAGVMQSNYQGNQDACAFKMASDLSGMLWSTYVGGSGDDAGYSIKLTENDEAMFCGGTNSSNLPTTPGVINGSYQGSIDGFIVNINNSLGSLNNLTYIGTSAYDQAYFVEIDTEGDIYVTGQTKGSYPVSPDPDIYSNNNGSQFIHKLSSDLKTSILSTVFGSGSSSINISPTAFLVDECQNVYVSGWGGGLNSEGSTSGLPTTSDAFQESTVDGSGMYFIVLQKNFQNLLYATHFGGSGMGEHVDGGTSRFDKKGIIYQGICACSGSGMPTTPNAWSTTNNGGCNLGSVKMNVGFTGVFAEGEAEPNAIGCAPYDVNFESFTNGVDFIWDFGDGSPFNNEENPSHTYSDTGVYVVTFIAIDSNLCVIADTTELEVMVFPPSQISTGFTILQDCENQSVTAFSEVSGVEGMIFEWNMGVGFTLYDDTVTMTYGQLGDYTITLTVTDTLCGIDSVVTQEISVGEVINSGFDLLDSTFNVLMDSLVCGPFEINTVNNSNNSNGDYFWDFGDGSPIVNDFEPSHTYLNSGEYEISLIIIDSMSCNITDTTLAFVEVIQTNYLLADFDFIANCDDSLVLFEYLDSTALPSVNYYWDFGDGDTSGLKSPSHYFQNNATYIVSLIVSDTGLCTIPDTSITPVSVAYTLDLLVDFDYIVNCEDTSVIAINTGTSNDPNVEYSWNMGDSSFYDGESVFHGYDQPGNYTVTFQMINIFCDEVIELSQEIDLLPTIVADFTVDPGLGGCSPFEVQFINNSHAEPSSVFIWNFGNNTGSGEQDPTITYDVPSTTPYDVTLILTDPESCNLVDTQMVQIMVNPGIQVDFMPDQALCEGEFLILDAGNSGSNYSWSTGENTQTIQIDEQGEYSVIVSNAYCNDSASTFFTSYAHPSESYSTELCPNQPLMLSALDNGSDYMWSTGDTTVSIVVSDGGIYWNKYLDENSCERSDTVFISLINETEQVFAPNSFTPNGDGINDVWKVYGAGPENDFEVQVFNRWGNLIWESKDINASWDGFYKGDKAEQGVYAYKLYFYSECYDKKIETIGTVLLLN